MQIWQPANSRCSVCGHGSHWSFVHSFRALSSALQAHTVEKVRPSEHLANASVLTLHF